MCDLLLWLLAWSGTASHELASAAITLQGALVVEPFRIEAQDEEHSISLITVGSLEPSQLFSIEAPEFVRERLDMKLADDVTV
jgi:hypothetical protein